MTEYGTMDLKDIRYFPCSCNVCAKYRPQQLFKMSTRERERLLAWHNLDMCFTEIRRIKQAIKDGRLWELLELRARGHPSLLQAFNHLGEYWKYLGESTPVSKSKGLLYFGSSGLARPELTRFCYKIRRWMPPTQAEILVLISQPPSKPFNRSREYQRIFKLLSEKLGREIEKVHFCFYVAPYGLIPLELDEVYPLSQFEVAFPLDMETIDYVAEQVEHYLRIRNNYKAVVLQPDPIFGERIENACKRTVAPERLIILESEEDKWNMKTISKLVTVLYTLLKTS
jgi:7-cyano-7-deazaguanine tRNA-ribosyltransferase